MKYLYSLLALILISASMSAQGTRQINGCVLDTEENPIAGATITLKETGKTTVTDSEGKFSLASDEPMHYAVASMEGFLPLELEIDGSYMIFRLKYDRKSKTAQTVFKAKEQNLDSEYNANFKNKGLINTIELSYNTQVASGQLIYKNNGYRSYGSLHPIEINYMIGYRINRMFSVSAGTGFICNTVNLLSEDIIDPVTYGEQNYHLADFPVFANVKAYFTRSAFQPLLSLSGGLYVGTKTLMMDFGVGCAFRFARICNAYIMASLKTTPWPSYQGNAYEGYKAKLSPGVKIGFTL